MRGPIAVATLVALPGAIILGKFQGMPLSTRTFPETDADRADILAQLDRILTHPSFSNSKRYPKLLRYLVEKTLENPAESLKERTLGIEVFGREPDYDTNLDHIVRTAAGEVRKRLQQYYAERGRGDEIAIDLAPGSYIPQFRRPQTAATETASDWPAPQPHPVSALPRARVWIAVALLSLAAGIGLGILGVRLGKGSNTPADRFWAPVLANSDRAMLCIGSAQLAGSNAAQTADDRRTLAELHQGTSDNVAFADALTMAQLAGLLRSKGKPVRILAEASASLADLTEGPAILIGAFDNDWTLRLTGPLRFRFELDTARGLSFIRDSQHPSNEDWSVNWQTPYLQFSKDYAIVSRVLDRTTGQPVVVVAGITKYGTIAAGQFLTTDSYLAELERPLPKGWEHKNIQVVLSTTVIRGSSGPPQILSAYVW